MKPAAIERVRAAAYTVPTAAPEADGTLEWDSTTAVVVHVDAGGRTGLGFTYGVAAGGPIVTDLLAGAILGRDAYDIPGNFSAMRMASRNALVPGVLTTALSAVDIALWDLKARLLDVPLAVLFGRSREAVPVYGSGGFTTLSDQELREQLSGWVESGIPRVKMKIGEGWGRHEPRDLHRIALARSAIGLDVELYVDANGAYTAKQAIRLAGQWRDADVRWFEEPVSSDDLAGLALVRSRVATDVAAGEYGTDPRYFRAMCAAGSVDCLQIDATRAGGYTGFLAAAAVAGAYGLQVSAHCAPALHTPVGTAVPNLRHIEYFADHVRLESMLFDGVPALVDGCLVPDQDRPGHGLTLREGQAERYRSSATPATSRSTSDSSL